MFWHGTRILLLMDSQLEKYVTDIANSIRKYFKEEGRKPSLEEFEKHLHLLVEEDFEYVHEKGINLIAYGSDQDGKIIYIHKPCQFMMLIETKYGIKKLYDEAFSEL